MLPSAWLQQRSSGCETEQAAARCSSCSETEQAAASGLAAHQVLNFGSLSSVIHFATSLSKTFAIGILADGMHHFINHAPPFPATHLGRVCTAGTYRRWHASRHQLCSSLSGHPCGQGMHRRHLKSVEDFDHSPSFPATHLGRAFTAGN